MTLSSNDIGDLPSKTDQLPHCAQLIVKMPVPIQEKTSTVHTTRGNVLDKVDRLRSTVGQVLKMSNACSCNVLFAAIANA